MAEISLELLVALGANLPVGELGPELTLTRAITALTGSGLEVRGISRFYATPCFPAGAGPDYVNAAVLVRSSLDPEDLLPLLHRIEHEYGRARAQRWGMRTLDMDIVLCGDLVRPDSATVAHWLNLSGDEQLRTAPDRLILPHPRLQDRAFVLVPAADLVPDWRHPVLGSTVAEMLNALPPAERAVIRPI